MTGVVPINPKLQFHDSTGAPLVGGTLTVYYAGTTSLAVTYQNRGLTTENTNPITLNARGECTVWASPSYNYKYVVKDSTGATIYTEDDIPGNADNDAVVDVAVEAATAAAAADAARVASDRLRAERARDALEAETTYVELLDGRTNGLSIDTTHTNTSLEVKVLDTTTPANAYNGTFESFVPLTSISFVTPKLCLQSDGTLKYQDHNDALQSEDFSNATWTKTNMSVATGTTGPDGTTTDACTLTSSATSSSSASQNITVLANRYRTHEFYVKKGTGAFCYIAITNNAVTRRAYFNLTTGAFATVDAGLTATVSTTFPNGTALASGWFRISAYHFTASTNDTMRLGICDADNNVAVTNGVTLIATKAHHYRGVRSIGYIKTTTVSKRGIPYDYTHGVRAIRFDVSTNYRGRWGNDLTNVAWTATNITAVLNATGPDNEPCSTLTATANNGTIIQSVTSSGTTQNFHAWVRRKTGTGSLYITVDNGSNWTDVTADIGTAGGDYLPVYKQGTAANPTVGFKIGTSGDEFEVALVNTSATVHLPPPAHAAAIDFTSNSDVFNIPTTAFPTGSAMTVYSDVYMHESSIGVVAGQTSRIGFYGAGTIKSTADLLPNATEFRLSHTWDDGVTSTDENWGDSASGRIQIQQRYKSGDCAMAANGNASWWNAIPGSYTFTSFRFGTIAQSMWLRRLVIVPEDIDDDTDDLRLFKLDDTDVNVNSDLLASAYVAKVVHDSGGILRIPGIEVLYERGDICEFITFWGQRNTSGYNLEAPQRMMCRKWQFDRSTNTLTPITDATVVYEPAGWATGSWGVQGYTPIKIKVGPYRGRLVLLYIQQDSAGGSPDDRNLYMRYSDDNGDTWSSGVKIVDKDDFAFGAAGFAATGENSTSFQWEDGPHEGRVYVSLNGNNTNHYAMWTDEFKVGATPVVSGQPGMSSSAWSRSTTPVGSQAGGVGFGTLTEPAITYWPDFTVVMLFRNSGSGLVGWAKSENYGVDFQLPVVAIGGDNASWNVNCGVIQDDSTGKLGRRGRLILTRSTVNGRIDHKVQSAYDDALTFNSDDNYRVYSKWRFVGYCPLKKLFGSDNIYVIMAEHQPTVSSNVNTSQMIAVFRY